jgi:flagellar biosynthetic protein FlhB
MADTSNKTEKPTPKRLEKARKEGQFLSSKDLVGAVQFVVFVGILGSIAGPWMAEAKATLIWILRHAFERNVTGREPIWLATETMSRLLKPLGAGAGMLVAATFGTHLVLTKFGFSAKKLQPSFSRLNPVSKLKEMVGRNVLSTVQAVLMLAIFTAAIYFVIEKNIDTLILLPLTDLSRGMDLVTESLTDLFWKASGVFVAFGLVDLLRQQHQLQKQLKMNKQEIKDEMKESDGDPHTKARIRRIRRDFLRQQMLKAVPKATAVIVNPTHYSVALRYHHGSTAIPVVVAKGKNAIAKRIRELAVANQIPLIENPPLAQALYKSVKVGQEIPPNLYRAVAEVLAYVYRMMMGAGQEAPRSSRAVPRLR